MPMQCGVLRVYIEGYRLHIQVSQLDLYCCDL